jgi:hypothetical protein
MGWLGGLGIGVLGHAALVAGETREAAEVGGTSRTARVAGEMGAIYMGSADILADAFGRIREGVHGVVDGLTPDQLAFRVDGEANSIAWLVWHLTRIQDDHVADAAQGEQVWTSGGWAEKFDLPFDPSATGYGHGVDDVAAVRVRSGDMLTAYYDAVHDRTIAYVTRLTDDDLGRIVDESWDPPVSLGVRLVSVIGDDLQHLGQAEFVRGVGQRESAAR